jgi:uncharacterized protein (UPF0276 family)
MNRFALPNLGIGLGLRTLHYAHILEHAPAVSWFEILSENYMRTRGRPLHFLDCISERYPIVMHGVSLSIGSTDPLDWHYLEELKALRDRARARWVSDHLCFTGATGKNTHDLLPLPYTEEALRHVAKRVRQVQDFLGAPLALENPATYVEFADSSLTEWQFLGELAREADCAILLDVNNVYVSAYNHGFQPSDYLDAIPFDRVVQIHVAGHTNHGTHIVDTHIGPVNDPVWQLFQDAHQRASGASVLLEWDAEIPNFEQAHAEALRAKDFIEQRAPISERFPMSVRDGSPASALTERRSSTPDLQAREHGQNAPIARARCGARPTGLRGLQDFMVEAIIGTGAVVAAAGSVFTRGPRLSARERFEIYQSGYRSRLVECLADDYPVLGQTLGEQRFEAICNAYIDCHPSHSPSLNAFGAQMSAFCRDQPSSGFEEASQFLADLAALEWALVEAIHAEIAAPFDFASLRGVPIEAWSTARLVPSGAVRILRSEYPVNAYYQACRDGAPPSIPEPCASATAVYRQGLALWRTDLTPAMTQILEALLAEVPIGDALSRMAVPGEDAQALAESERSVMVWFEQWVRAGIFAGVHLEAK